MFAKHRFNFFPCLLYIYPSIYLSIAVHYFCIVCLSIYLFSIAVHYICREWIRFLVVSVFLSIYQSIYLSIYLSITIYLSVYLSIYLSILLSLYIMFAENKLDFFSCLSLSINLSINLSIYQTIYLLYIYMCIFYHCKE